MSTVEEKEHDVQPDPTEDPLSDLHPAPCSEPHPAPAESRTDLHPAPCSEQSRTEDIELAPMSNDEGDQDDEDGEINDDHYVPEAEAEEEMIVPEEHLPMETEEVVVAADAPDDSHVEPDNNNAEVEKDSTEVARLPTVAPVIESNEDSHHDEPRLSTPEEIVPDCDTERDAMQEEQSASLDTHTTVIANE